MILRYSFDDIVSNLNFTKHFVQFFFKLAWFQLDIKYFTRVPFQGYLQGNSTLTKNSSTYEKYEYWDLGNCCIKVTIYKRLLCSHLIFKKIKQLVVEQLSLW